jgi:hypothetical protein
VVASGITEVAEGNLVQGTFNAHDSDSEHISHVSVASSNRAQIIQARSDLERALLREKQQETPVRKLEVALVSTAQPADTGNVAVVPHVEDVDFERELSRNFP